MNAFDLLWLVPVLPFASSMTLIALPRLPRLAQAVLGVGSVGLSACIALWIAWTFHHQLPAGGHYTQVLWQWMNVGGFKPNIALYVDALSLTLMLVITCVGGLIHLFSAEYMAKDDREDQGYGRYFAYLNLFVAAMLLLVLGDNLLLLYLGWEGVGICSYLLIGFWYKNPVYCTAARKSFIVTRVGDTAMVVGLIILFTQFGTLDTQALLLALPQHWQAGAPLGLLAALLLLAGACGKSAQLPLHTWLPDAMAGPTPVSALIHAATMVTAGVYLIARMHPLFQLEPVALHAVAWVGAATILLSGFTALGQNDIKRVLAWSTVSQIGYMFFALGVGAWGLAIFHLVTHAFFKALLFLSAGAIINSLHHEQDMRNMGGLWRLLPRSCVAFVIGGCSLMAIPWVTAGYYSKDAILDQAWSSAWMPHILWGSGVFGALLTGLYTTRLLLGMFAGKYRGALAVVEKDGVPIQLPLLVLAVLALAGGLLRPDLSGVLPEALEGHPPSLVIWLPTLLAFLGIYLAWLNWRGSLRAPRWAWTICANGFGFDALYDLLFVRPYYFLGRTNRGDVIDAGFSLLARASQGSHRLLALTENGRLRWYAVVMVGGMVLLLALALHGGV